MIRARYTGTERNKSIGINLYNIEILISQDIVIVIEAYSCEVMIIISFDLLTTCFTISISTAWIDTLP